MLKFNFIENFFLKYNMEARTKSNLVYFDKIVGVGPGFFDKTILIMYIRKNEKKHAIWQANSKKHAKALLEVARLAFDRGQSIKRKKAKLNPIMNKKPENIPKQAKKIGVFESDLFFPPSFIQFPCSRDGKKDVVLIMGSTGIAEYV